MIRRIYPKTLKGSVNIPSSKSVNHRAIIASSLSEGTSRLTHIFMSDDILATIEAMRALGATIKIEENALVINGINISTIKPNQKYTIDCNESGSTIRFLIPILSSIPGYFKLLGRGQLLSRPMDIYEDILSKHGVDLNITKNYIELDARDSQLNAGTFNLKGNVSSQFVTGLLFVLPLLKGNSKIIMDSPLESYGYVDLTLDTLKQFSIEVSNYSHSNYKINGNQSYRSSNYEIEGDYSQAAFFLVANFLGNNIQIQGLNEASKQSDREMLTFLEQLKHQNSTLTFDGSNCPDIIPALTLACSFSSYPVKIINIGRLRIKECDRLSATVTELNRLGAKLTEHEDSISIDPIHTLHGGLVSSHSDHRMAMMLAIAATRSDGPVLIEGAESVNKSFPTFWEVYQSIGGVFE